jgi:hypothetical protein
MEVAALVLGIIALIPILGIIPAILAILFGAFTMSGVGEAGFVLGVISLGAHAIVLAAVALDKE